MCETAALDDFCRCSVDVKQSKSNGSTSADTSRGPARDEAASGASGVDCRRSCSSIGCRRCGWSKTTRRHKSGGRHVSRTNQGPVHSSCSTSAGGRSHSVCGDWACVVVSSESRLALNPIGIDPGDRCIPGDGGDLGGRSVSYEGGGDKRYLVHKASTPGSWDCYVDAILIPEAQTDRTAKTMARR